MTDADALIQAIHANPRDHLPRLVFADWLEERGEGEYAQYIRLCCEVELREPTDPERRKRLRKERHKARLTLTSRWAVEYPDLAIGYVVTSNGLPSPMYRVNTLRFLNWTGPWPFFLPSNLELHEYLGFEERLAGCPRLSEVYELWLVGFPPDPPSRPPYPAFSDPLLRSLMLPQAYRL